MKKNVVVFGTIAGLIVSTLMFISMLVYNRHHEFKGAMIVGYASMLIAFSFIFVGIKNFRDKYNNGSITFGKGFLIGLLISFIASTFYVVTWLFELKFFIPDFMESYSMSMMNELKESGGSQLEIDQTMAEVAGYQEMYKNPVYLVLLTYAEIFPVGLLVSLISATILRRKARA